MIFLHGVTDSWHSFERLLPLLPPEIHTFALSQRGHGNSSRPTSGYRFADMSEDLRAFMDATGLRTATIVGHSMGASVAQRFAIDHPARMSGLVLMAAFATFQDPDLRDFVTSSILPLTDPIEATFAREWQLSTLARPMDPAHFDTIVAETVKVPAFVWHEVFKGFLATDDFTSELANVSVPTLLAWGDRDTYTLRAAQDRLLQVIPGAGSSSIKVADTLSTGKIPHGSLPTSCNSSVKRRRNRVISLKPRMDSRRQSDRIPTGPID